jgi:hypothetical protein
LPGVFSPISFDESQLEVSVLPVAVGVLEGTIKLISYFSQVPQELSGSPFIHYVEATKMELQEIFSKLFPWIYETFPHLLGTTADSPITWKEFLWAYLAIYSRAFRIMKDGREGMPQRALYSYFWIFL